MQHFIGGFGGGWLLAALVDAGLLAALKKNTSGNLAMYCIWGVFGGLAAWGLLP
jgi:hypothetical protein